MKVDQETIDGIMEIVEQVEDFRPIIKKAVEALMSLDPEIKAPIDAFICWSIEERIKHINLYIAAGFDKQDAIAMTLDDSSRLIKAVKESKLSLKSNS